MLKRELDAGNMAAIHEASGDDAPYETCSALKKLPAAALGVVVFCITGMSMSTVAHAQAEPSFACLASAGNLDVLVGLYNEKLEPTVEPNKIFDARDAEFENPGDFSHGTVSLEGNGDATDMCWAGGFFMNALSWHDLDISWQTSKDGVESGGRNTSQINAREPRMTITGVHAYNVHDGIKVKHSQDWLVQHCWVDYARDDAIESDDNRPGTLYDCLIDGAYTGFSSKGGDSRPDSIVRFDRVLMRMEPMPYPYKWDTKDDPVVYVDGYGDVPFGHGSAFKIDEDSPHFDVRNSVFLHEYDADETVFPPPDKVVGCENNTLIWLDGPETAPTWLLDEFPGCFTIITDYSQGKAFWAEKVADWHERHPEVGLQRKPADPGEYSWPRYGSSGSGGGGGTSAVSDTPTANFSASCTNPDCSFTDTSTDSDGTVTAWSWDFGDGGTSTAQNPTHTYAAAGSYMVSLTVTDDDGATDSSNQSITVTEPANTPPMAGFSVSTTELTATFTDTSTDSDGSVTAWSWDFGAGSGSTAQNPSHTYATAGSHTVTLIVTDDDGDTSAPISMDVTVTAPAAQLAFTGLTTQGGDATMVAGTTETVTVFGSGFDANASLSFESGTGPAPTPSGVSVSQDGTLLTAVVTAKSGGPPRHRLWDVRVTNPNGSSAVLAVGLTVMR